MPEENNNKKRIWLVVLILALCVVITVIVFTRRLYHFYKDDSGAISLIPEEISDEQQSSEHVPTGSVSVEETRNLGFEVEDHRGTWSTNTSVEIFKVSYENGQQNVTVKSDNGDKLIAPGTENAYTFKLKNTGDVALDYTMMMDISCTPELLKLPVEARVRRYDGTWVSGRDEEYVSTSKLNEIKDATTLGAGRYTYYTLEWTWPFESGHDAFDTELGTLAEKEDLTITVSIRTTASECGNPDENSGIITPKTGDNVNVRVWLVLLAVSMIVVMLLKWKMFYRIMRITLLIACGAVLGINVYLANANSLVGNQLPMPFGYGTAIVLSGSMEPTFSEGALLIVKEAESYEINDIVVYQDGQSLVVHRIIDVDEDTVTTKGDANQIADAPVHIKYIKGKVLVWIPVAGTIIKGIKTPVGTVVIILVAIALVEIPNRRQRRNDDVRRQKIIDEIESLKKEV